MLLECRYVRFHPKFKRFPIGSTLTIASRQKTSRVALVASMSQTIVKAFPIALRQISIENELQLDIMQQENETV